MSVKETFEKRDREKLPPEIRLIDRVNRYKTKYGFDLATSEVLSNLQFCKPKDCLLDFRTWAQIVPNWGFCPPFSEVYSYYVLSLWDLSKGVYIFNKEFENLIPEIDLKEKVPDFVLKQLPEWCIYVHTPDWVIENLQPSGFFSFIDYHPQDGYILSIVLDLPGEFFPIGIPLDPRLTYLELLKEESSHVITKNVFWKNYSSFQKKEYRKNGINIENPHEYRNPIRVDWLDLAGKVLKYTISRLLYICAKNASLENKTNPSQPIRRSTYITNPVTGKTELSRNLNCSVISVGEEISNLPSSNKIKFSYVHTTNDEQYLEIVHDVIKSVQQQENDQLQENSLVTRMARVLVDFRSQLESMTQKVEQIRNDNLSLTEEGIKYFSKFQDEKQKNQELEKNYGVIQEGYQLVSLELNEIKKQLDKVLEENVGLTKENSKYKWAYLRSKNQSEDRDVLDSSRNLILKVIEQRELTPLESLTFISEIAKDRVDILASAWDSVKQINNDFKNNRKLLKTLFLLVTDYLDNYLNYGDSEARKIFSQTYSAQESDTVTKSEALIKYRNFCGQVMTQHIKIGYSERLYFTVDRSRRKIIIGYCGKHLPISSK